MSFSEKPVRSRKTVLPPVSCRTLQHPSFLPLYIINPTSFQIHLHGGHQTVYPIIPEEVFYSDPMGSGMRIWNTLTGIRIFSCSQLNAPQPIMSIIEAPPNHPDPFRSGPHPTRDLGNPTWRIQSLHPQAQPQRAIIQLTPEEDQAVTNLLKLHHQEAPEKNFPAAHLDFLGPAESSLGCLTPPSSVCVDAQYPMLKRRRQWVEAVPDPLLCQSTRTPQKPETSSATVTSDVKNSAGWSKTDESQSDNAAQRLVNLQKRKRWKEQTLTDLEEDAVSVLLSLGNTVSSETLQ